MSHRRIAIFGTAATVLFGIVPLLSAAHADGLPDGYPAADCFTYSDPTGDASFDGVSPSDPDLDILGAALETTATSLKAYAKVNALSDSGPAYADGHRYTLRFTFNGHVFSAAGSDYGSGSGASGSGAIRDGLAQTGQAGHITQLGVDTPAVDPTDPNFFTNKGFVDSGLTVTFDYANSWVVWDLPTADIVKYGGAPFTGDITAVSVFSATDEYLVSSQWDTTVKNNGTDSTDTWTIGDNTCFGPPAAGLANVGATKVQFGDTATLSAKLTDATGSPLAEERVTFAIGRLQTSALTNAKGIASAKLTPTGVAGSYSLTTTYGGSATVGRSVLSTPFTVTEERTVLSLVAKGTGVKRTVTATLRDDDRHALAGQKVTWLVNGKTVKTAKTSTTGTVTLTAKHGQTVRAVFARVAGKYVAAGATKKV